MNKVILIGNMTRDPEQGTTPTGVDFCKFSIAVSRDYVSGDGNREADFFNCTAWRKTAELCLKYLKKGNKVGIVGRLENRTYDDKEGVKHTVTDVIVSDIEFLTPKAQSEEQKEEPNRPRLEPIDDNNLPF